MTSFQELHVAREQRAMLVAVHVETDTLRLARHASREAPRVNIVGQATQLLPLADICAHVGPIAAIVLALLDGHAMLYICKVLAIGVHIKAKRPVCSPGLERKDAKNASRLPRAAPPSQWRGRAWPRR
jgi:hypothetical protein